MSLQRRTHPRRLPTAATPTWIHPRTVRWFFRIYLVFASAAFFPAHSCAQEYRGGEYELKAAMLFNLVKFVEWPASAYSGAQAATVLCTLGRDPFGSALDEYAGNQVNGRPLVIRRLRRGEDPQGCHLIYVSSSEGKVLTQVLKNVQGELILTVGEMEQFAARGGMIQLTVEDKQVHFTINLSVTSREQLRIRSNLLALSRIVETNVSRTETGFEP
jgi:uncharacterized protein DUF4154